MEATEYVFLHEGEVVGVYSQGMAEKILSESVNAFGIAYDGKTQGVEYHAKGSKGILDFDFYWSEFTTQNRVLH